MGIEPQQLSDSDRFEISVMALRAINVSLEVRVPGFYVPLAVGLAASDVVLDELGVLLVEAVRRIGMAAVWGFDDAVRVSDGRHEWVLADHRIRHDPLNLDHDPVGGAGEPAIAKTGAEMLAVAVGIGPADMDDCPIRTQGWNGDDLFRLTDRVGEFHQIRIELRNAGADAATPSKELLP